MKTQLEKGQVFRALHQRERAKRLHEYADHETNLGAKALLLASEAELYYQLADDKGSSFRILGMWVRRGCWSCWDSKRWPQPARDSHIRQASPMEQSIGTRCWRMAQRS